jgi:hypothetical protein
MELKSLVQVVLREAGYDTWLAPVEGMEAIAFEDEDVMGFACFFPNAEEMVQHWRVTETLLVKSHSASLRRAGEKTWNVYCVFLSTERANEVLTRQVRWIEEDLERTRKIAACGITSRESLVLALLPVLPLQYQPVLDREDFDVTHRLRRRIADIADNAADTALDEAVSPTEVVRLLGVEG